MAREIVSSWDNVNHLVQELIASNESRKTYSLISESMEPNAAWTMKFSLEDETGMPIKFPLKLVADTNFQMEDS